MSDVLADKVRAYRLLRRLEQADVAEGMNKLRHHWKAATVSEVERGQRNVTVDELLALGLVLETAPFALLDPVPITGGLGPDLDVGTATPLPTIWARRWLRGEVKAKLGERDDGTTFVLGWETSYTVEEGADQ
jgi:transcriptional regulator with XRE-family HTH domain